MENNLGLVLRNHNNNMSKRSTYNFYGFHWTEGDHGRPKNGFIDLVS